eukprot:GCRY01001002.1.p1 GENE.GCRY01001002.1~~GCRY01001002.1.p1  ORF type:complete len:1305 (+),score=269.72 GCRY01001002.1:43-3957(+)
MKFMNSLRDNSVLFFLSVLFLRFCLVVRCLFVLLSFGDLFFFTLEALFFSCFVQIMSDQVQSNSLQQSTISSSPSETPLEKGTFSGRGRGQRSKRSSRPQQNHSEKGVDSTSTEVNKEKENARNNGRGRGRYRRNHSKDRTNASNAPSTPCSSDPALSKAEVALRLLTSNISQTPRVQTAPSERSGSEKNHPRRKNTRPHSDQNSSSEGANHAEPSAEVGDSQKNVIHGSKKKHRHRGNQKKSEIQSRNSEGDSVSQSEVSVLSQQLSISTKMTVSEHKAHSRRTPQPKGARLQIPIEELIDQKKQFYSSLGYTELGAAIAAELDFEKYDCMVCLNRIRSRAQIWTCRCCFAVFHYPCIIKWSNSVTSSSSNADNNRLSTPVDPWRCPACNQTSTEKPVSHCFCGKETRAGACCSATCGRRREGTDCPHPCALPCHPGPCPSCPRVGKQAKCHCGKSTYFARCDEPSTGRACLQRCGKPLACGVHVCQETCHPGPCAPCNKGLEARCFCGKETRWEMCGALPHDQTHRHRSAVPAEAGEGLFRVDLDPVTPQPHTHSCGQRCLSVLACGNHLCPLLCHSGPCPPCPFTPESTTKCPCGAQPLSMLASPTRTACTDPIPTCGGKCPRECSEGHPCPLPCHEGPCPPCAAVVRKPCRCGATTVEVPCAKLHPLDSEGSVRMLALPVLAPDTHSLRSAPEMLQLAKSSVASQPVPEVTCTTICNRKLNCGRHRCARVCCAPQAAEDQGLHVCTRPCNKLLQCGIHRCQQLCHRGYCGRCLETSFEELRCACGHEVIYPPVPCGTKPPHCDRPCTREQPCGHRPAHTCHEGPCPPCPLRVARLCACGSHTLTVPCHVTTPSCGRPCLRSLPCGHKCQQVCHAGACGPCTTKCGQLLPCGHECEAACHKGSPCPGPCKATVVRTCPCGRRKVSGPCGRGVTLKNAWEGASHGPAPESDIPCDHECARVQRLQSLASALDVKIQEETGHRIIPHLKGSELFSSNLIKFARENPALVHRLETQLGLLAADGVGSLALPAANTASRRAAHELARVYGFTSESVDQPPHRSVIVKTISHSSPAVPPVLLSKFAMHPKALEDALEEEKNTALLLHGLNDSIRTPHLHILLKPFRGRYNLHWIDDENCMVVFDSVLLLSQALNSLQNNEICQVRRYNDADAAQFSGETKSSSEPLPQRKDTVQEWQVMVQKSRHNKAGPPTPLSAWGSEPAETFSSPNQYHPLTPTATATVTTALSSAPATTAGASDRSSSQPPVEDMAELAVEEWEELGDDDDDDSVGEKKETDETGFEPEKAE